MMRLKHLLLAAVGMVSLQFLSAQNPLPEVLRRKPETPATTSPTDPGKKRPKPIKQDLLLMNFNWNGWMNQPGTVDVSPFSRGFDIALMGDIPLGRSNFSLGIGLGLSTENIFTNAFLRKDNNSDSVYFQSIRETINPDTANRGWDRYKLGTTMLELPLEVRFRIKPNKRNTFKIAAGFKIGYVIHSKDKYVGPNYLYDANGNTSQLNEEITMKTFGLPGINRFRYGVYGRIGYGRVAATFQYSLQPFFEAGRGLDGITPISIGLTFVPF